MDTLRICANCGKEYEPNKFAWKQKYCPECSPIMAKKRRNEYRRKYYQEHREKYREKYWKHKW